MKTYEEIALDMLRELGTVTLKEWALALGYKNSNAFWHVFKKLRESGEIIEIKTRPHKYKIKEERLAIRKWSIGHGKIIKKDKSK
jgi:hypothetical protein